jgi:hypothetical protein
MTATPVRACVRAAKGAAKGNEDKKFSFCISDLFYSRLTYRAAKGIK